MKLSQSIACTAALAVASLVLQPVVQTAEACGGFFRKPTLDPEKRPSLTKEKVLLIYDGKTQHFIRDVAFRRATEPFGFVVPTPTRPEVAAIAKTPFTALRKSFQYFDPMLNIGGRGLGGDGKGGAAKPKGVEVLEKKKVGSFTAFVLAATDAGAMAKWLADNGLSSTTAADAWLAHYVDMKFYYVAMRYDPPKGAAAKKAAPVAAETIKISFATPIPYYPYIEPEPPATPSRWKRKLEVWFVGSQAVSPIALYKDNGKPTWVRPLARGVKYEHARSELEAGLDSEIVALLPKGDLVVQPFVDGKFHRKGYGDILFPSWDATELSEDNVAALEPFLRILDPALAEGE